MSDYDSLLGRRETEDDIASIFEAEFPLVTGRSVEILSRGESPDCEAMIDGVETGLELTSVKAASAEAILAEVERLAAQKGASYTRRNLFTRPIMLLCHLDWPSRDQEGVALFDIHEDLQFLVRDAALPASGFSEIWLMDEGSKYTSRRDPRAPADFFCFAPNGQTGFYQRERKRRPYWGLVLDRFA